MLVAEAGGKCEICGYDRLSRALQFHHVDPRSKEFSLSGSALTYSLARLRREARKCALLCGNCHVEVEDGLVDLPEGILRRVSLRLRDGL
jgi:hypothetical protein